MFTYPKHYDVLVIGAGHAGVEAALAAARMGCQTLLLTQNLDTIGQMSCNPAVGGLAKGHMVREIDALGGFMGLNADATAIQCRILNASKGPSVRGPRAQCDKKAYQFRAKFTCEEQAGLDLQQGNVARLLVQGDRVFGVETQLGVRLEASSVVVTTGTFMRGLLHVGQQNQSGGRMGDAASSLSDSLRELGFAVGRFKTGTPCRLNGRSVDFMAPVVKPQCVRCRPLIWLGVRSSAGSEAQRARSRSAFSPAMGAGTPASAPATGRGAGARRPGRGRPPPGRRTQRTSLRLQS